MMNRNITKRKEYDELVARAQQSTAQRKENFYLKKDILFLRQCVENKKISAREYGNILGDKLLNILQRDDAEQLALMEHTLPMNSFHSIVPGYGFYTVDETASFLNNLPETPRGYLGYLPENGGTPAFHLALGMGATKCAKAFLTMADWHGTTNWLLEYTTEEYPFDKPAFQFVTQEKHLHLSEDKKIELVHLLLSHGANPYDRGESAQSGKIPLALQYAEIRCQPKLATVLKNAYREWDKAHPFCSATETLSQVPTQTCVQKGVQNLNSQINNANQRSA